jgi:hypothetical protein
MTSCCRRAKFSRANSHRSLNRDLREAIRQKRVSIMDAKAASLRQKRQRFQCGRGCGKGQVITRCVTSSNMSACIQPSSAAWMICAGSSRFEHATWHSTRRSRNLAPFSRAFLPDRLESCSNPGNRCPSMSSSNKNQGSIGRTGEDGERGSRQFDQLPGNQESIDSCLPTPV